MNIKDMRWAENGVDLIIEYTDGTTWCFAGVSLQDTQEHLIEPEVDDAPSA